MKIARSLTLNKSVILITICSAFSFSRKIYWYNCDFKVWWKFIDSSQIKSFGMLVFCELWVTWFNHRLSFQNWVRSFSDELSLSLYSTIYLLSIMPLQLIESITIMWVFLLTLFCLEMVAVTLFSCR